jgi:hypothetical protein
MIPTEYIKVVLFQQTLIKKGLKALQVVYDEMILIIVFITENLELLAQVICIVLVPRVWTSGKQEHSNHFW